MNKENYFTDFIPNITIFGIGGAGLNALNCMIMSNLHGVNFIGANTDAQALRRCMAENVIQLGLTLTKGLGAGANPDIGEQAAIESENDIKKALNGTDLLFITSGMGGGTGSGASHIVAKIARQMNILTVAVVTTPFNFEGPKRLKIAKEGLLKLENIVDTLIVVSNDNLLKMKNSNQNMQLGEVFKRADDVLSNGVRCITEIITKPGFINTDFADVKTVLSQTKQAMIGYGEASGENRDLIALENATINTILENGSIKGATKILVNITGGKDLTINEVERIINSLREQTSQNVDIIFGTVLDSEYENKIAVSIIATGINTNTNEENLDSKKSELLKSTINTEECSISPNVNKIHSQLNLDLNSKFNENEIEITSEDPEFEHSLILKLNESERVNVAISRMNSDLTIQNKENNNQDSDSSNIYKNKPQKDKNIEQNPLTNKEKNPSLFDSFFKVVKNTVSESENFLNYDGISKIEINTKNDKKILV